MRPHLQLSKMWPPWAPPGLPPHTSWKRHTASCQVHINLTATYQGLQARVCQHIHVQRMDALQWGCDQKQNPSFRCWVHRLDYTAALQCILQQIKLNTRDYSPLWNTLDRDQCDLFFKLNLKWQRFEKSYKKYSNAVSHNTPNCC